MLTFHARFNRSRSWAPTIKFLTSQAQLHMAYPHAQCALARRESSCACVVLVRPGKKKGRTLPAPALTSYFGQPDWVLSKGLVEQCGFFCWYPGNPCLNSVAVLAQLMDDITLFSDNYFAVVHIASLFIVEHCGTSLQVDTMSLMSDVTSSKFNVQCKLTQKTKLHIIPKCSLYSHAIYVFFLR